MKKTDFLALMHFPSGWKPHYPDDLFTTQLKGYEPGQEDSSEHTRNGAFHWWLSQNPSKETLNRLVELAELDPDSFMALDVLGYILDAEQCDRSLTEKIELILERLKM